MYMSVCSSTHKKVLHNVLTRFHSHCIITSSSQICIEKLSGAAAAANNDGTAQNVCDRQRKMSHGMNVFFIVFKWQRKTVFWTKFIESRVKCQNDEQSGEKQREKTRKKSFERKQFQRDKNGHTYDTYIPGEKFVVNIVFTVEQRAWERRRECCCCEQHNVNGVLQECGMPVHLLSMYTKIVT